jgi:hypothetical protein
MKAGAVVAAVAGLPLKSVLAQDEKGVRRIITLGQPVLQQPTPPTFSSSSIEQLNYYTQSTFAPYVNTRFRVRLGPLSTRALMLKEVSDYQSSLSQGESAASTVGNECFSLLFTIAQGKPFEQDTYQVQHDALGTFFLFVVPVGGHRQKGPDYYEAVIYRREESAAFQNGAVSTAIETVINEIMPVSIATQPPVERVPAYNFEGKKIEGPVLRPVKTRRNNKIEREDLN